MAKQLNAEIEVQASPDLAPGGPHRLRRLPPMEPFIVQATGQAVPGGRLE